MSHAPSDPRLCTPQWLLPGVPGRSRILADFYISSYLFIHFYIFLFAFAYFLHVFVYVFEYVYIKFILNKRGAPEAPPTH